MNRAKSRFQGRMGISLLAGAIASFVFCISAVASTTTKSKAANDLMTKKEGRTLLQAAWKHKEQARGKPDCSHLVHQIYYFAGYPYPYANSFGLYRGTRHFVRVKKPQPGDLIVWKGHVGMVVDPKERTFYSSVNSGLKVGPYNSRYWRRRGTPRFFRYVRGSGDLLLAEAKPRAKPFPAAISSSRPGAEPAPSTSAFEIPSSINIVTAGPRPRKEEIAEALGELSNTTGNVFRSGDILSLPQKVVIYDRLEVLKVNTKGKRGTAPVRFESSVTLEGTKIKTKRRKQKTRVLLRRGNAGWEAVRPKGAVYVPRYVAVRALAEQLELVTRADYDASGASQLAAQQEQLARVLYALLVRK